MEDKQVKYVESKPFSNGMEYEFFRETWCDHCSHCKLRDDMFPEFPENGGCDILDAMERARFDIEKFPTKEVVEEHTEDGVVNYWHKCTQYTPAAKDMENTK